MKYKSTIPFAEDELKQWLEDEYNVVGHHIQIRPGYMSTVAFVETPNTRFVLKCVKNEKGALGRLETQVTLLEELKANGVPVATCVTGAQGKRVYIVGDYLLSMWTFLVGEGFVSGNRYQIAKAGEALAGVHRAFLDVQNIGGQFSSWGWLEWVSHLESEWGVLAGSCAEGKALVNCLTNVLNQWTVPSEAEQRIVIHNDFRAQNLVFESNAVSGIFDFDAVCIAPRIFDVAYSLIFFQAVVAEGPLDIAEMSAFIKGYHNVFPIESGAQSDMLPWLGLALLRGLTLWGRIAYVDCVNLKPKLWIQAYLPLIERLERVAQNLRYVMKG